MNKKVFFLGSSILISITSIVYIILNNNIFSVNANPDYICTKSVSGQPCQIKSCGEWRTNGTRECVGTRVTQVSYYHVRTDCEAGYTISSHGRGSSAASGRQGADYVSGTESCTIIQTDNVAPEGNISGS